MLDTAAIRRQFPALARTIAGRPAVFFDGPAGSQVPRRVIDAIGEYLVNHNANHGGAFATSRENDALLAEAQAAVADLLGTRDPGLVVFGANMTTLTFAFSRALARDWKEGDEVVVTQLDHDANVSPWVRAAEDRGATVRRVRVRPEDCTLDLDDLKAKLSRRTRLVAVGCASNAVGTRNPVAEIARLAHAAGSLVFLDAVHLAPHALLDVEGWDCDFLACSAYKFFGPHVGILWGRRELLERLPAYKVRPASEELPDRWMTGTPNFEGIAGVRAAVEYLAELGSSTPHPPQSNPRKGGGQESTGGGQGESSRRGSLRAAFTAIEVYERNLGAQLLRGLAELPSVRVWGITDPARHAERVPTVSFTHRRHKPLAVAEHLAKRGIFVWHGNFYALPLTEALGLEPDGMVRVGLLHYNTAAEVDRLLEALAELERA